MTPRSLPRCARRCATLSLLMLAALGASPRGAAAHGDAGHADRNAPVRQEQTDWGIAGDARQARTVQVRMSDAMRFSPAHLQVRLGETIRFVIRNDGKMLHEFVIGTTPVLQEHAALMLKFPDMEHSEPYMAHVPAGQSGQIVWTFNRPGDFDFACLIAGHYQAGMKGTVRVVAAGQSAGPAPARSASR